MKFGMGPSGPIGPGYGEPRRDVDPAEQAAQAMWERAEYKVPNDWSIEQIEAQIAREEESARAMSQRSSDFASRDRSATQWRTSNTGQADQARRDAIFVRMKIAELERRKSQLQEDHQGEVPDGTESTHDFVQALNQGFNGEEAGEPKGSLAQALEEGYAAGPQGGDAIDPTTLGDVFAAPKNSESDEL